MCPVWESLTAIHTFRMPRVSFGVQLCAAMSAKTGLLIALSTPSFGFVMRQSVCYLTNPLCPALIEVMPLAANPVSRRPRTIYAEAEFFMPFFVSRVSHFLNSLHRLLLLHRPMQIAAWTNFSLPPRMHQTYLPIFSAPKKLLQFLDCLHCRLPRKERLFAFIHERIAGLRNRSGADIVFNPADVCEPLLAFGAHLSCFRIVPKRAGQRFAGRFKCGGGY